MQYFAGANTRRGFKSIFDECFKGVGRIFILKGSSGCGKSTLMKRVASAAEARGLECDVIRCSADPESLDGVIVKQLSAAVVDGTAPHIMDVKYPCVRESIVNLGQFWDESMLLPHREQIIALTDGKAYAYADAYRCLAAKGTAYDLLNGILNRAVMRERLDHAVIETAKRLGGKGFGKRRLLFSTAFSSEGVTVLPTFGDVKRVEKVSGEAASIFMSALFQTVNELDYACVVSLSHFDAETPDAIYFEESDTLVTSLESPQCASFESERKISCGCFTDGSVIASHRARIRALSKLMQESEAQSREQLARARVLHGELERIYIPAMDFKALDRQTDVLIKGIFGE